MHVTITFKISLFVLRKFSCHMVGTLGSQTHLSPCGIDLILLYQDG